MGNRFVAGFRAPFPSFRGEEDLGGRWGNASGGPVFPRGSDVVKMRWTDIEPWSWRTCGKGLLRREEAATVAWRRLEPKGINSAGTRIDSMRYQLETRGRSRTQTS